MVGSEGLFWWLIRVNRVIYIIKRFMKVKGDGGKGVRSWSLFVEVKGGIFHILMVGYSFCIL